MDKTLVRVRWTDSAGRNGWMAHGEGVVEPLMEVVSVGLLLANETDRLILAQSWTVDDERVADTLAIPYFAVQAVDRLEPDHSE